MVVARAPRILGNVYVTNPQLVTLEIAVRVNKRRLAQAQRLNLGAHKHDACDVLLQNLVVEGSSLVADIYISII